MTRCQVSSLPIGERRDKSSFESSLNKVPLDDGGGCGLARSLGFVDSMEDGKYLYIYGNCCSERRPDAYSEPGLAGLLAIIIMCLEHKLWQPLIMTEPTRPLVRSSVRQHQSILNNRDLDDRRGQRSPRPEWPAGHPTKNEFTSRPRLTDHSVTTDHDTIFPIHRFVSCVLFYFTLFKANKKFVFSKLKA